MKKSEIQNLLEKIEGRRFISDKFQSFTNNKKLNAAGIKDIPQSWVDIHFKTYPRFDRINLSNTKNPSNEITQILGKRRSSRNFLGLPISKDDFFYLLYYSCGLTYLGKTFNDSRRPYPSAGARYPLEVYPIVLNCKGIEKGLYHYNVKENALELLLKKDLGKWLIKITGGEKWIKDTAIVFIITGILDRTRVKYGDRGYRFALLEAGHLGQNVCLLATERNLGICPLGGYIDEEVNKLLDIQSQREVALYMIAVGKI